MGQSYSCTYPETAPEGDVTNAKPQKFQRRQKKEHKKHKKKGKTSNAEQEFETGATVEATQKFNYDSAGAPTVHVAKMTRLVITKVEKDDEGQLKRLHLEFEGDSTKTVRLKKKNCHMLRVVTKAENSSDDEEMKSGTIAFNPVAAEEQKDASELDFQPQRLSFAQSIQSEAHDEEELHSVDLDNQDLSSSGIIDASENNDSNNRHKPQRSHTWVHYLCGFTGCVLLGLFVTVLVLLEGYAISHFNKNDECSAFPIILFVWLILFVVFLLGSIIAGCEGELQNASCFVGCTECCGGGAWCSALFSIWAMVVFFDLSDSCKSEIKQDEKTWIAYQVFVWSQIGIGGIALFFTIMKVIETRVSPEKIEEIELTSQEV